MNIFQGFMANLATAYTITTASAANTAAAAKVAGADAANWVESSAHYAAATAPNTVRTVAPKVGIYAAQNVAFNIFLLEGVDILENLVARSRRKRDIRQLHEELIANGKAEQLRSVKGRQAKHDELIARLEVLQRAPKPRTFFQWLVDLPSRMWRRLTRAVLFEAGWWASILTSPLWLLSGVATLVWNVGVLATTVFRSVALQKSTNVFGLTNTVNKVNRWIFQHTLAIGWGMMTKAGAMRLHDDRVYTSEEKFPEIKQAHEDVVNAFTAEGFKVEDRDSAYRLGWMMAQTLDRELDDAVAKQQAIAQAPFWVEKNVGIDFAGATQRGMRAGAPFIYRDLAQVF